MDGSCTGAFHDVRTKRDVNAVVYRLNSALDGITVESQGNVTHEELVAALPVDQPRIVLYELAYATSDGTRRNELVMVSWVPEACDPAAARAYAQARSVLRTAFDGPGSSLLALTPQDMEHGRLVAQVE